MPSVAGRRLVGSGSQRLLSTRPTVPQRRFWAEEGRPTPDGDGAKPRVQSLLRRPCRPSRRFSSGAESAAAPTPSVEGDSWTLRSLGTCGTFCTGGGVSRSCARPSRGATASAMTAITKTRVASRYVWSCTRSVCMRQDYVWRYVCLHSLGASVDRFETAVEHGVSVRGFVKW
jgi:hypothetical protein